MCCVVSCVCIYICMYTLYADCTLSPSLFCRCLSTPWPTLPVRTCRRFSGWSPRTARVGCSAAPPTPAPWPWWAWWATCWGWATDIPATSCWTARPARCCTSTSATASRWPCRGRSSPRRCPSDSRACWSTRWRWRGSRATTAPPARRLGYIGYCYAMYKCILTCTFKADLCRCEWINWNWNVNDCINENVNE